MLPTRELSALLSLIDDPDEEVYQTVHARLMSFGTPVIPQLETHWENTYNESVQGRIEMVIHRIHFSELKKEFLIWAQDDSSLLHGALLVAKYQYPEIQSLKALQEIERMRRNLWLEMNNFITPIEQVKIVESILYKYYNLLGGEIDHKLVDDFMIHKVIERKKGNTFTNGILYLILAEMLDIPVKAIKIPQQYILGYFSHAALFNKSYEIGLAKDQIKFFVDPHSGIAFSHKDLDQYFSKINQEVKNGYFKPLDNKAIIQMLLQELSCCFSSPENKYKKEDIAEIISIITKYPKHEPLDEQ